MLNDFVKIECSGLPTIYPVSTYIDKFYTSNRVVKDGQYDETLTTAEKYATILDTNVEQRNIQILLYNKYTLTFFVKESSYVEYLKYADNVAITLKNGDIHHAKILSLEKSKADATQGLIYTLSYADKNPANYSGNEQSIANFLRSDVVSGTLNSLTFSNSDTISTEWTALSNTYTIKSILSPKKESGTINENTQQIDNLIYTSRQINSNQLNITFYLTEEQARIVGVYLPLCTTSLVISSVGYAGTYVGLERTIPEITKIEAGIDLYECKVSLKYENIVYNNYNN